MAPSHNPSMDDAVETPLQRDGPESISANHEAGDDRPRDVSQENDEDLFQAGESEDPSWNDETENGGSRDLARDGVAVNLFLGHGIDEGSVHNPILEGDGSELSCGNHPILVAGTGDTLEGACWCKGWRVLMSGMCGLSQL